MVAPVLSSDPHHKQTTTRGGRRGAREVRREEKRGEVGEVRVRRALTLTLALLLAPTRGTSQGHPQVKGRTVMLMMEGMGGKSQLSDE